MRKKLPKKIPLIKIDEKRFFFLLKMNFILIMNETQKNNKGKFKYEYMSVHSL